MSTINIRSVTFYYADSDDKIFDDLTLNIDTGWKMGLIGRNGRGKTTLLNLINGNILPLKGEITSAVKTFYFPFEPANTEQTTFDIIKENIAPFRYWEMMMDKLSNASDEKSMMKYGEMLELYQNHSGYEIDSRIEKEFSEIGMDSRLLNRDFSTLSAGEQTRALIISLFLKKDSYPLLDEPTDHLDIKGRMLLGEYLSRKKGFIIASHDRKILDKCTDHVLSINRSDVRLNAGNYSNWKYNIDLEGEFEKRKNENLRREIRSLESSAKERRKWADAKEKEKKGAYDKGYIGHKSAKQMKRALHIEMRIENKLETKKSLLKNTEDERKLVILKEKKARNKLINVDKAGLSFENKKIFEKFSLEVYNGERVALTGTNGSGKTSLLRAIMKELPLDSGAIYLSGQVEISYSHQIPLWRNGLLREHLREEKIDETKFRNILGVMGVRGEIFDRPLETFSRGEQKKAELCKSFMKPASLFIWDEPLNYLDVMSREQLEEVILKFKPTMLFTEHDKAFIDNISTRIISMDNY